MLLDICMMMMTDLTLYNLQIPMQHSFHTVVRRLTETRYVCMFDRNITQFIQKQKMQSDKQHNSILGHCYYTSLTLFRVVTCETPQLL